MTEKENLKQDIALDNLGALFKYSGTFYKAEEDISYLMREYQRLYDKNKNVYKFLAEYARIMCFYWEDGKLSKMERQMYASKILATLEKALSISNKEVPAYTYLARFYSKNPECPELEGKNLSDLAEKYYNMAIRHGSTIAIDELKRFTKKKNAAMSFDLYNTDENLNKFIENVNSHQEMGNIQLLLYGPEGSGKMQFAYKLLDALNMRYTEISAKDFDSRTTLRIPGEKTSAPLKDAIEHCTNESWFILHHMDGIFYGEKSFESTKNSASIIELILSSSRSIIYVAEDIANLPSNMVNAFPFRIKFNYMEDAQKAAAFNLFFSQETTPQIDRLGNLVVDDFVRIKKRAIICGYINDNERLIQEFEREAKFKAGGMQYLKPIIEFKEELVNCDTDLIELSGKLQDNKDTPFTMMVYGVPGTGKSYYLRYLAEKIGINTIEVTPAELFSTYQGQPAKNLVALFRRAEEEHAMIIMDEIEEIAGDRTQGMQDWKKDVVNAFLTCLENCKVPFTCTTNHIDKIDKAMLRRFVFKLKFDYLNKAQCRYAFEHAYKMEAPAELDKIGGLTNGDFSTVKKKAIVLDVLDNKEELLKMLQEESEKKALVRANQNIDDTKFDKAFINAEGLDTFEQNIKRTKKQDFTILLYGPSGTGKSLYLRHLAKELGYEVIERRGSDIRSKWIGETEKNIAQAFEEAKARQAFLVFDEIDSFLPNKENIANPAYDGFVNEFMVQLENHPYPVGGSTNYLERMENASLRRFKYKIKFDYLKPEQYEYMYKKTFGVSPIKDITKLKYLTPAFFASVAEKADLADAFGKEKEIYELFIKEAENLSKVNASEAEDKSYEKLEIEAQTLYDKPISEEYNNVLKGFVKVITPTGHGSGFFITKDGFILTNKHVVEDETSVTIELFSGRQIAGEVIRVNSIDVALIKVSKQNSITPMPLRLEELNVGSTVFSMGNPSIHDQVLAKGAITRYTEDDKGNKRIETDNFSFGGVSGGPLMDENGNVIGINVAHWLNPNAKEKVSIGLAMQVPIIEALESLNVKMKKKYMKNILKQKLTINKSLIVYTVTSTKL